MAVECALSTEERREWVRELTGQGMSAREIAWPRKKFSGVLLPPIKGRGGTVSPRVEELPGQNWGRSVSTGRA